MKCSVKISSPYRNDIYKFKKTLHKKYMLKYNSSQRYLTGTVNSMCKFYSLKTYCVKNKLKFEIDNSFGVRSADYRKVFFSKNKPILNKWYICSYCGKLINKKYITVDHLYPVAEASSNYRLQKKLKRKGFVDVNDPRNLIAACLKCNQRKSSSMSFWIIKGKLGRIKVLWIFRWIIRLIIFCIVIRYLYLTVSSLPSVCNFSVIS